MFVAVHGLHPTDDVRGLCRLQLFFFFFPAAATATAVIIPTPHRVPTRNGRTSGRSLSEYFIHIKNMTDRQTDRHLLYTKKAAR